MHGHRHNNPEHVISNGIYHYQVGKLTEQKTGLTFIKSIIVIQAQCCGTAS